MQVTINKCYGGFCLSDEAVRLCIERGCPHYEVADEVALRKRHDEYQSASYRFEDYIKGIYTRLDDGRLVSDEHRDEHRDCQVLAAVVTELGAERAGTHVSRPYVVEIPDDVRWHVAEYDGYEHVAEDHRVWS